MVSSCPSDEGSEVMAMNYSYKRKDEAAHTSGPGSRLCMIKM
jgi:hypothetical protein